VVAEPQYGAGARFEVCFPCVSQIVEKKASHQGPYTILVLEDDPLILDVIEAFLSIANYCVLPCSNIEQAKRELQEHDVHCIVSDVILGDRAQDNGILFCKELKNTGFPNPICIISGFIPDTDASIPSSWYFLAKPFQRLSFLEMVQTIIRDNVIVEHTKEVMLSTK
jgi:DNA-binding response OmpR family regulator